MGGKPAGDILYIVRNSTDSSGRMLEGHRAEDVTKAGPFRLAEWHDAKGYGWIDAGGRRVFAHIKDFAPGQRRPVAGDEVTFTPGTDEQGRPRATAVRLVKQAARIGPGAWGMLGLLLVAPVAGGIHDGFPWWMIPAWYAVASLVAWCLYASDKRRAREGGWRVEETTLHLVEILGGWPGAFLAQRRFRHKTVKRSFQGAFWLAVAIHQFIAIDELTNSALIDAMWKRVSASAGGIGEDQPGDWRIAEAPGSGGSRGPSAPRRPGEGRVELVQQGETRVRGAVRGQGTEAGFRVEFGNADRRELFNQFVDADVPVLGQLAKPGVFIVGQTDR